MRKSMIAITLATLCTAPAVPVVQAAPGDPVYETCPAISDVGDNVDCYPVAFTSKTEVHPDGIPIIGYLFVPRNRPAVPLPAIVFAHGSGSMYSSGNHNSGLNSKHRQWVRQYTNDQGIVSLHVSSFHSRYLLPDTAGDQRVLEIDVAPAGIPGGDDYRATSTPGGLTGPDDDLSTIPAFDPEADDWKDQSNGEAGVSEVIERAYDMDAAWDFLAGLRPGSFLQNSRNDDDAEPTLGTPMTGEGYVGEIVTGGLVVDHERIFLYGTSHGGQTAMATAHAPRALDADNPMNADLPAGFNLRRFAGFFDYYGGCGLYGAYNGANYVPGDAAASSSWRPYGSFLMLHGEADDIWKEQVTGTIHEQWLNSECKPRIDAARADPAFDQFLEAIIYEDAEHSFDGVERADFSSPLDPDYASWLAKIHANYRITLPFIEAVGRQVAAGRNSQSIPTLAALGFSGRLPYFDTFPLTPSLGPQPIPGSALHSGEPIPIGDLGNGQLDVTQLLVDPFENFAMSCDLSDELANVSESSECVIDFTLTGTQMTTELPHTFWIRATTQRGTTVLPVRVALASSPAGTLTVGQPLHAVRDGTILTSEPGGGMSLAVDGLVWTRFPHHVAYKPEAELSTAVAGYSIGGSRTLDGPVPPASPATQAFDIRFYVNGSAVIARTVATDLGDGLVTAQLTQLTLSPPDDDTFATAALPAADFSTNFVALDPLLTGGGSGGGGSDGGGSGGDGSGGDGSGGDGSGGDGSGGDDSGGDDSGGDDSGGDDSGGDGSGGGALLLWPLILSIVHRRCRR